MKTMIPNNLRFDLDLQDLPARASGISSEAFSLSAAGIRYFDTNVPIEVFTNNNIDPIPFCKAFCLNNYEGYTNIYAEDNYDSTLRCGCGYR